MEFLPHILRAKSFTSLPCLIIIALLGFASASSAFDIASYLPNTAGSQWSYGGNSYHTMTRTIGSPVALPGVGLVIPWTDIKSGEYGYDTTYVTVGGNGILVHQEYDSSVYVSGYGYTSATTIYTPAVAMAPADVTVGATYTASGTVTDAYANIGTFSFSYTVTTNIVGIETVSDKSGTQSWPAMKVIMSRTISGISPYTGQFFSSTSAETMWMVDGLGIVQKSSPDDYGAMETWKLTSTNVSVAAGEPSSLAVPRIDADVSYTVGWAASSTPGATYILEEATNSSFTAGLRTVYSGGDTSVTLRDRTSMASYYYRVRAAKPGYTDSPWRTGGNGCLVQYPKGDMNGDGMVRLSDAVVALKAMSGRTITLPMNPAADTDGDHKLSISDVLFILRQIAAGR